jgi:hypothetical protein
MHATTKTCEAGGRGRSPLSKLAAYRSALATKVSVLLKVPPGRTNLASLDISPHTII